MKTDRDRPYHLDTDLALVHRRPTAAMLVAAVLAADADTETAWRVFTAMVETADREQAARDAETESAGEA